MKEMKSNKVMKVKHTLFNREIPTINSNKVRTFASSKEKKVIVEEY